MSYSNHNRGMVNRDTNPLGNLWECGLRVLVSLSLLLLLPYFPISIFSHSIDLGKHRFSEKDIRLKRREWCLHVRQRTRSSAMSFAKYCFVKYCLEAYSPQKYYLKSSIALASIVSKKPMCKELILNRAIRKTSYPRNTHTILSIIFILIVLNQNSLRLFYNREFREELLI